MVNIQARLEFPFLHETAESSRLRKPQEGVEMIEHHHESDAPGVIFNQQRIGDAKHNSLRMIVIQQSAPAKYGKRDEMAMQSVINNSTHRRLGEISTCTTRNNRLLRPVLPHYAGYNWTEPPCKITVKSLFRLAPPR
jgi:hypothetical protein